MPKIELVAPAGGWGQFIAAVNAGADSVYLGYRKYGARAYAENFDLDGLYRAVILAHSRGIKVYLTLNTILKDSEIYDVGCFLNSFTGFCRDGIIIQDWGACLLLKDIFSSIPLHASTQMNIHNQPSLEFLKKMGFRRAVLAREMTLEEISGTDHSGLIEIEVFGHGSQCFSYSGRCYLSSFAGGRSGNRGRCTQPCRMKYEVSASGKMSLPGSGKMPRKTGQWNYYISKNDLCSLGLLPRIIGTGVNALKIEGRMKTAEYTAMVIKTYRKYIDLYYKDPQNYRVEDIDLYKLRQVYSRDLCTGYLEDSRPAGIISAGKAGSVGNFLGRIDKIEPGSILIKSRWPVNTGDILEIWTKKGNRRIEIRDIKPSGTGKNDIYRIPVETTGDLSPKDRVFKYFDSKVDAEIKEMLKITREDRDRIKTVTGLSGNSRYMSPDKLDSYLLERHLIEESFNTGNSGYKTGTVKESVKGFTTAALNGRKNISGIIKISVNAYNSGQAEAAAGAGADYVILNDFESLYFKEAHGGRIEGDIAGLPCKNNSRGKSITVYNTPPVVYDGRLKDICSMIEILSAKGECIFKAGNPGILYKILEIDKKNGKKTGIFLSHDFNISNSLSVNFFHRIEEEFEEMSLLGIDLSPEINTGEISGIIERVSKNGKNSLIFSVFGHGYFPVSHARYRFKDQPGKQHGKSTHHSHGTKTGDLYLKDRQGYMYRAGSDFMGDLIIYNPKKICLFFDMDTVASGGVRSLILDGLFHTESEIAKITGLYRRAADILSGQGEKTYRDFASRWENDPLFMDYSRGHLIRGVD